MTDITPLPQHREIAVILDDAIFTEEDRDLIRKFYDEVDRRVEEAGIHSEISMFDITEAIDLDLSSIHKEGPLMYALWVALLSVLKRHYRPEDHKYPTFESFLETYSGRFEGEPQDELERLWHTANWMSVLFTLIAARKNKGLAMQVVPKLVEGWHTKYVTGSGQTRRTANRVLVFETEGNTRANHRGKVRPKKKRVPKRSTRKVSAVGFSEEQARKRFREERPTSPMFLDGHTDADDDSSVNEDVQETFESWRQLPAGGEVELVRCCSAFDFTQPDLAATPSMLQRGVSWTEIPISLTAHNHPQNYPPSSAQGGSQPSSQSFPVPQRAFNPAATQAFSPLITTPSESLGDGFAVPLTRPMLGESAVERGVSFSGAALDNKTIREAFNGYMQAH